jgi:hypothetical protein
LPAGATTNIQLTFQQSLNWTRANPLAPDMVNYSKEGLCIKARSFH